MYIFVAHFREKIHTRRGQVDMLEDKNKLDQIGNELQRSTGYTFTAGHRASAMRIIWKQAQAMNREREREREK